MRIRQLFTEGDDPTLVPYEEMQKIRKLIKKGAMDPDHQWANALDLVIQAYQVIQVERPTPSMEGAWKQYEDAIEYCVAELNDATLKGVRDDSWKSLSSTIDGIWNK